MPVQINKKDNLVTEDSTPEVAPVVNFVTPISETKSTDGIMPNSDIRGLSALEMNDPNSISVTIADPNAPLIVLFGPPACGKTMTLVRLTSYLRFEGYTIGPIKNFRPASDSNYVDICTNFDTMINNDNAAKSNARISFMLVEVIKNGRRLCQILEAPGEFYFNPEMPNAPFPNYVNTIINSDNRKIWTIMVEPDWLNQTDRKNYVSKITFLKKKMRPKDRVVFLFNKIDLTNFVHNPGNINNSEAIKEIQNLYPNIFIPFLNQNPITKLWKKYNCNFVPFQTGSYTKAIKGITYQEGPREYCVSLWNTLMKKIYG
jgi:GTPase SAR1 family protein